MTAAYSTHASVSSSTRYPSPSYRENGEHGIALAQAGSAPEANARRGPQRPGERRQRCPSRTGRPTCRAPGGRTATRIPSPSARIGDSSCSSSRSTRGGRRSAARSSVNSAAAVRGPKHAVTKGHDAGALARAEARKLLESIDTGALAGARDRALVSVMLYARVSAVPRDAAAGLLRAGEPGLVEAPREGREATRRAGAPPGRGCP